MKIANVCLALYNFSQLHKNNWKDLKVGTFYQLPMQQLINFVVCFMEPNPGLNLGLFILHDHGG